MKREKAIAHYPSVLFPSEGYGQLDLSRTDVLTAPLNGRGKNWGPPLGLSQYVIDNCSQTVGCLYLTALISVLDFYQFITFLKGAALYQIVFFFF